MRVPYRKPGKFSEMQHDPLMTKKKFDELSKTLMYLKSIKPQAAAEVSRLAEMGDFSENAEYQAAKGRLRGINHRILLLEQQLNRAVIIEEQSNVDTVGIGHWVTVVSQGKESVYQILGSAETRPESGIISHTSPIGAALMGHRVGESVSVRLPKGDVQYTILRIE